MLYTNTNAHVHTHTAYLLLMNSLENECFCGCLSVDCALIMSVVFLASEATNRMVSQFLWYGRRVTHTHIWVAAVRERGSVCVCLREQVRDNEG